MIEINLLPATEARKRSKSSVRSGGGGGGSQLFGVLMILLLVAEVAGLYIWYSGAEDAKTQAFKAKATAEKKLTKLKEAKKKFDARDEERQKLNKQQVIFANLEVQKKGPYEALQFLAYALTKKDSQQTDEIEAHETVGWSFKWDPDTVWLREIVQEDDGFITLKGVAKTTQDAAEFLRRLASSIYFIAPDMPLLQPVEDQIFPDKITLTAFEIQAVLNFNRTGELRMLKDDIPDSILKYVKLPKPKPKAKPKTPAKKGKKA